MQKACRDYGLSYDPNCEILITVGGTQAIFIALMGLPNERDEVLIPDPGFVALEPCVLLAGGVPVYVPLREDNDSRPSMADVTSLITDKSRVMTLNHPNNPPGSVVSYYEVTELSRIPVERDLAVISDEVYEEILYDGAKPCSGLSSEQVPEFLVKEATVLTAPRSVFGSQREDYLRLSCAAAYENLEEALNKMQGASRKLG